MFQHQRGDRVELTQFLQEDVVIQVAETGAGFIQMDRELVAQDDVFGVTGFDLGTELLETFTDDRAVLEVALWAVDQVDRIEMHRELLAVNSFDQPQI